MTLPTATLVRRLAKQHPGFLAKGSMLIAAPLQKLLRGYYFDRSSSPGAFYVYVFFMPLCIPADHVTFSLGHRIGRPERWHKEDPDLDVTLERSMQKDGMPFLNETQTVESAAKFALSLQLNALHIPALEAYAYLEARSGNNREAIEALATLKEILPSPRFAEHKARAELLQGLLTTDPIAAQQQLCDWEAYTAHALRLDKFVAVNKASVQMSDT